MSTTDITLDCGCRVQLRETYEYGCAGDCHPGQYVTDSGELTEPCARHSSVDRCDYDCDGCREDDEERSGEYHDPHGFLTLPPHGEEM